MLIIRAEPQPDTRQTANRPTNKGGKEVTQRQNNAISVGRLRAAADTL